MIGAYSPYANRPFYGRLCFVLFTYVFRENLVLTLMGIVVGLPLGILLHRFVMNQIQVDMVAFKVAIMPVSYLLSVVIVLLFLKVVDLVMRRKIDHIDMAESLKSIE